MSGYDEERDVSFEIIEEIGVIATQNTGWTKELNLVSWNGGVPKYDIREWDPFHQRMSKGITLHENEMRQILELLRRRRNYASRARRNPAVSRGPVQTQSEQKPEPQQEVAQATPQTVPPVDNQAVETEAVDNQPVDTEQNEAVENPPAEEDNQLIEESETPMVAEEKPEEDEAKDENDDFEAFAQAYRM